MSKQIRKVDIWFYTDKKGEHRWRAMAANGKILADSSEGYKNKEDAKAAVKLLFGPNVLPE